MKMSSTRVPTRTMKVDSDSHQASMLALPWASSSPRLGVEGGTPRPRKSRLVRARMAPDMRKGRKVITGVMLLGSRWRAMMVTLPTPSARAALTYSMFRPLRNSART